MPFYIIDIYIYTYISENLILTKSTTLFLFVGHDLSIPQFAGEFSISKIQTYIALKIQIVLFISEMFSIYKTHIGAPS